MATGDLVARWEISLPTGNHVVEFEHGTTSGRRVIRVDEKEIYRKDWMFKLVGSETFPIEKHSCKVTISPVGSFAYEYTLTVDGIAYKTFSESRSRIQKTWALPLGNGEMHRIVLERDTLDVWVDGQKLETAGEFVEDGTETHFEVAGVPAVIKTVTSGKRREGILHVLFIGEQQIPEATE